MNTGKIKLIISITIFYLLIQNITHSQNLPGLKKVHGIIADSITKGPLEFVTVRVFNNQHAVLKTVLTNSSGYFEVASVDSINCYLGIEAMGYEEQKFPINFSVMTNSADLGTIFLHQHATELTEVTIRSSKPIIKRDIDRLIYDVQADPESKVGNVLDLMRKVPYLSLDAHDNLLMKGNSSYKILINGKPSSLLERDAKEVLRAIPASTIQRIEVITTPPSKYDAEGLAGIINIVTNKKIGNGYNGTINLNTRFPTVGPGVGGTFTLKQGRAGILLFAGASAIRNPETDHSLKRVSGGVHPVNLKQEGVRSSGTKSFYLGTEFSFEIDSLQLLSTQFSVNGLNADGLAFHHSFLTNTSFNQAYSLLNQNLGENRGLDASINYQRGFKNDRTGFLTFSYRFLKYKNVQATKLSIDDRLNYDLPDYMQKNAGSFSERTFQIDYTRKIGKVHMESGIKGILRVNKSNFRYDYFDLSSGLYKYDPDRSNLFRNNQNIAGAYSSYQYSNLKLDFKGGIRIEKTFTDVDFMTTASRVRQNYFTIIPSLVVNRKFQDRSSLNLGFNQRIRRPGINRLNPFVDRSNPNYESSGNPNLKPVILNTILLGYGISKKFSMNAGISYSFVNNLDLRVSTFDAARNITRTNYQNTGKASNLGFDYNINVPIKKNWNFMLNGNIAYFNVEGMVNTELVRMKRITYYLSPSSNYQFGDGWQINGNLAIIGRNPTDLQGSSNGVVHSTFSVTKSLAKEKFTLSAVISNPFTKFRNNRVNMEGPDFTEFYNTQEYFRGFGFSINYRFGKLNESLKQSRRVIRNDDVAN